MYFGRNAHDPAAISEAQTRLQAFRGATAISSNAYFGRDEEEDVSGGGMTVEGMLGDGTLANLEMTARDVVSRVLNNPDVQSVGETIRAGALKVCSFFFGDFFLICIDCFLRTAL
jgi:ADP-ribosylation factor GTPase-activating protein 2/3